MKAIAFPCLLALSSICHVVRGDVIVSEKELGSDEILIESFASPMHKWKQMNDPVMGGKSTGSFHVENGLGIFKGEVVNVPFLQAPGFVQSRTVDRHSSFPDISSCTAISFRVKSNTDYQGYRVSFGNAHASGGKMFAYGYKSNLSSVPMDDFGDVVIDLTDFTDFWDDATGDAIVTCQENSEYCPDELTLKNMKTIAVWAEGVAGKVSLEIESIKAVGCSPSEN